MKKLLLFLTVIIGFMFISNCGEDGSQGRAYLKFSWDSYVDWYTDNNPSIPYSIYEGQNYETSPGVYSYEYGCSNSSSVWGYYGTYSITVNPGEEGSLFTDGADGSDKFYTFMLGGYGAWMQKPLENLIDKKKNLYLLKEFDDSYYEKVNVGEVETKTINYKYGSITITRQAVQWIKK